MRFIVIHFFLSAFWVPLLGFRFGEYCNLGPLSYSSLIVGAVFREKEDAHLVSAFTFAIEWINTHQRVGRFEYVIEFIHDGDYFGAISKGFESLKGLL